MVVCKFFQQGNCRYGKNCRFDHIYGSKYSYNSQSSASASSSRSSQTLTDEQLVSQVQSDVLAALKGGQWILSAYAPFREKSNLPGLSDVSPDELRWLIYEGTATNNFEQAISYANNIATETRLKYEQLLHPTQDMVQVLRRLYNGETPASPFSTGFNSGTTYQSGAEIFRTVQNTNYNNNFFSPQNNDRAKSIFAQATQNVFGAAPNTSANSIFASASQKFFGSPEQNKLNFTNDTPSGTGSIFWRPEPTTPNVFGQHMSNNGFEQNSSVAVQNNRFFEQQNTNAANVFRQANNTNAFSHTPSINILKESAIDNNIYSKLEELTKDVLEAFQSDHFELGFIPEVPPPQGLCF